MGITAAIAAVAAIGTTTGLSIASSDKASREASRARDQATQKAGALPIGNEPANENQSQKEAEKRRRMYAGVGRSSTILTGPAGLGAAPTDNTSTTPKQLLGI